MQTMESSIRERILFMLTIVLGEKQHYLHLECWVSIIDKQINNNLHLQCNRKWTAVGDHSYTLHTFIRLFHSCSYCGRNADTIFTQLNKHFNVCYCSGIRYCRPIRPRQISKLISGYHCDDRIFGYSGPVLYTSCIFLKPKQKCWQYAQYAVFFQKNL